MTELPAPLTPADCDLRSFQFMPLDVGRLRDSDLAALETPEACWSAVLLWCASWHQVPAASIPDDDRVLAQLAGFGRVVNEWKKVKEGALRGWIKCADGRLYHPVVAEKARDAWEAKHAQRYKTECARIKKHNQRHGTHIPFPSLEAFLSPDYVDPVPRDIKQKSPETTRSSPQQVPRETASKGQGEGQGEVNTRGSNDDVGDLIPGDAVDNSHVNGNHAPAASSSLSAEKIAEHLTQWERERGKSPRFAADAQQFVIWSMRGITAAQLRAAYDAAVRQRDADSDVTAINAGFLDGFVAKALAPPKPKPLRTMSHVELEAEGRRLGVSTHGLALDACIAKLDAARRAGGHAA